jgi:hypothetical protein
LKGLDEVLHGKPLDIEEEYTGNRPQVITADLSKATDYIDQKLAAFVIMRTFKHAGITNVENVKISKLAQLICGPVKVHFTQGKAPKSKKKKVRHKLRSKKGQAWLPKLGSKGFNKPSHRKINHSSKKNKASILQRKAGKKSKKIKTNQTTHTFTSSRGVLMGTPGTWFILNVLNLFAAERAGLKCIRLCGDDLIGVGDIDCASSYKETLGLMGFLENKKKSFIGQKGSFCEKFVTLDAVSSSGRRWEFYSNLFKQWESKKSSAIESYNWLAGSLFSVYADTATPRDLNRLRSRLRSIRTLVLTYEDLEERTISQMVRSHPETDLRDGNFNIVADGFAGFEPDFSVDFSSRRQTVNIERELAVIHEQGVKWLNVMAFLLHFRSSQQTFVKGLWKKGPPKVASKTPVTNATYWAQIKERNAMKKLGGKWIPKITERKKVWHKRETFTHRPSIYLSSSTRYFDDEENLEEEKSDIPIRAKRVEQVNLSERQSVYNMPPRQRHSILEYDPMMDIVGSVTSLAIRWRVRLRFAEVPKISNIMGKPKLGFERPIQSALPRLQALSLNINTSKLAYYYDAFMDHSILKNQGRQLISLGFRPGARVKYAGLGLQRPSKADLKWEQRVEGSMIDTLSHKREVETGSLRKTLTQTGLLHPHTFLNLFSKRNKIDRISTKSNSKALSFFKISDISARKDKQWPILNDAIAELNESLFWTGDYKIAPRLKCYRRFNFKVAQNLIGRVGKLRRKPQELRIKPKVYKKVMTRHQIRPIRLVRINKSMLMTGVTSLVKRVLGGSS